MTLFERAVDVANLPFLSSPTLTMAAAASACVFHGYTFLLPTPAWQAIIWFLLGGIWSGLWCGVWNKPEYRQLKSVCALLQRQFVTCEMLQLLSHPNLPLSCTWLIFVTWRKTLFAKLASASSSSIIERKWLNCFLLCVFFPFIYCRIDIKFKRPASAVQQWENKWLKLHRLWCSSVNTVLTYRAGAEEQPLRLTELQSKCLVLTDWLSQRLPGGRHLRTFSANMLWWPKLDLLCSLPHSSVNPMVLPPYFGYHKQPRLEWSWSLW